MLINGRFLTRRPTGVDRFALEILRAVHKQQPMWQSPIVTPIAGLLESGIPDGLQLVRYGKLTGHIWEQFDLPRLASGQTLVNLCNTAPVFVERQLVVIHDAAIAANPSNFGAAFRAWYSLMLRILMRRARIVATVSKFSADELVRAFGKPNRTMEIIYEGGEHILREPSDESILDRLHLRNRRYILAVGSQSHNKNFNGVLKALDLLNYPDILLVAVGGANSRVFADTRIGHMQFLPTGYVSDGQLRALYEHACCFAYPSFYEGFGLPPLEAMLCGCPVVVSNRASLPEVCGNAAWYCDPEDPASIAEKLRGLVESEAARDDLRSAGYERSRQFSWSKAAETFLQIMKVNFGESC